MFGITWKIMTTEEKESGFANLLLGAVDASCSLCKLTGRSHVLLACESGTHLLVKQKLQSIVLCVCVCLSA